MFPPTTVDVAVAVLPIPTSAGGNSIVTDGGFNSEYCEPIPVISIEVIAPPAPIVADAVAVEPIPTPLASTIISGSPIVINGLVI